jgi:hypothetical protein
MSLGTNIVKISGVPSENGWSQSFEYSPPENVSTNTSLLVIVFSTIRKNMELDDAVLGRELLKRFREEYFSDKDKNPDNSLRDSVKTIFNDFFQKLDGLEIAAACLSEGHLYATCINGGKVSLYRDQFLVKILDSNTPQLVSASGFPQDGDIMVLATSDFYKKLNFSEIKDSFLKGLDAAKDFFSMKLHSASTASIALIEFVKNGAERRYDNNPESTVNEVVSKPPLRASRIFQKTSGVLERIKRSLPRKRIFLRGYGSEVPVIKSRATVYIGIILTLLLGVSVIFGIYKNKKDVYKSSYSDTLSKAKLSIDDAINLKGIEISRSREALIKGKTLLEQLRKGGIKDPEIEALEKQVSENEGEILGEKRIGSEMWLDLTLILDGFSSEQIVGSEDLVYVMDPSKNKVISIDLKTKKSETIKIADEIKNVRSFHVNSDEVYFLTDDGIYQNSSKKKVIEKSWEGAKFFASYSSNIYILDSLKGEILKSAGADTGYMVPKKWTTADNEDFSSVRSFVINGFVWVLTNSQIIKYSYGNNIKFELKGYPYELPNYDLLFTNENSEDLYLLSKEAKTISVFNKDGEYKYNFITDIISEAKDFMVSEDERKIILLTGEKLYSLSLGK